MNWMERQLNSEFLDKFRLLHWNVQKLHQHYRHRRQKMHVRLIYYNKDEVEIQLVLSARQNKVDYYLIDAYSSSFVTGQERSDANSITLIQIRLSQSGRSSIQIVNHKQLQLMIC